MRSFLRLRTGAPRAVRALVMAAALLVGAAFHEGHHAARPHCDGDAHSTEHACGCSVLHAAALVAHAQDVPSPARFDWLEAPHAPLAAPAVAPSGVAGPRAPPAA
jgi:hypothetical protein